MNYNKISQLLDNGLSPDEIVMTLMKTAPKLAKKIRNMLTGGLGTGEILNGLMQDPETRNVDFNNARPVSASEMQSLSHLRSYNSVPDSREKEALKNLQKFTRQAINIGSSVGGAYALSRAIPKAIQAIPQAMQQILPGQQQNPQGLPGATPNVGQQAGPITNNLPIPQQPPVSAPNIPQQQPQVQPEVKTTNVSELLTKSGLKKHVDDLSQRIKDPKQIAGLLYSKFPKEMKDFQVQAGKNMEDAIGDYLNTNPAQSGAIPAQSPQNPVDNEMKSTENKEIDLTGMGKGMTDKLYQGLFDSLKQGKDTFAGVKDPALAKAKPAFDAGLIKSPKDLQEFLNKPKIEKSSIVASPNGIGTVKEIRNGQAIIDVDGKLHKVKESELESEPEEVRNAKFGFDLNSIPEDLRSAPLNEVYLPHDRRHVTVKYNAGLQPKRYIYFRKDGKNIPTDYINKIVEGVQLPTTSGKSFWGVWNADKADSRGSANYHELVKNAQEEGEPDDPSKEYWFIEEEALYEHPYMEKKGKEELRQLEKEFNEKRKKRKKKGS